MKKKSLFFDRSTRADKLLGNSKTRKRVHTKPKVEQTTLAKNDWNKNPSCVQALRIKNQRVVSLVPGVTMGSGTKRDPISIPLRTIANSSNCFHCPVGIEVCMCQELEEVISRSLMEVYTKTSYRRQHAYGRHPLNSKSVLPVFVTRVLRLLRLQDKDVFWDLGCGIGNVVIQAALQHGVNAVGIDIQSENIEIAENTWRLAKAAWSARYPERTIGSVHFVKGDMFRELEAMEEKERSSISPQLYPTKVWMSNQLFTPYMNHQLANLMTQLKSIHAVCCMYDIFPHERLSTTRKRNPKPYEKFAVMKDYMTQKNALEWSSNEERLFYMYSSASQN